ncbi:hypothetical protein A3K73_00340 [Candidatus Pacearchaeota archaeon RBG_13_36_9]|nr:MAG: hypothetical protein A3K73_00340 [Candidatus Pacearchaeota archaeon RBG_13_36_9]HJX50306.1 hypothetical protein [Candidatus Nanoarchaeia archaeon]
MAEYKPTKSEKKKYVLKEKRDLEILGKCKALEKKKLSKSDKILVKLIKTQLEDDWRNPLLKAVNKLVKKYEK